MDTPGPCSLKLSVLDKRIKAFAQGYRQNLALIGNDTDEISYLLENYLQHNRIDDLVYIHVSAACTERKEFFKSIVYSLLSDYTRRSDSLDKLINYSALSLKSTSVFIQECLKKPALTFLDILETINKFINESRRNCVLVMEDFLNLNDLFNNLYPDFSKFIILQRNCMVVLATHRYRSVEKVLSGELNLLFGNFEKINLQENAAGDNLLRLKQQLAPAVPSEWFLSFFTDILGSNTIYYHLIAKIIQQTYSPENEIAAITAAVETALAVRETYFFQKFNRMLDGVKANLKNGATAIKLLLLLSAGYLRKKDLAALNGSDPKEFNLKLQKLIDLQLIENLGNIYKINDPLFSFWLNFVFRFYFLPPVLNSEQRKFLFRKKLLEEISIFKEEYSKNSIEKMLKLFSSFQDDNLKVGKNKYRLPLVEKTKIISYSQNNFHLLIGEGKEIIFAGIKEKKAQESDIFDFIEKGSNIKGARVKKIFVSLGILPPAARIIAKNNKIALWDINEVNRIANIYNRPPVASGIET